MIDISEKVLTEDKPQPRRPEWIRAKLPYGESYAKLLGLMRGKQLHTVCEEARCPNLGECWGRGTATFMILGDICTRSCGFCAVKTGRQTELDTDEPRRVAEAVMSMNLRHVVITSVNRDELRDGGASIFAETIRQIRIKSPKCRIEILIPDFRGDNVALDVVVDAAPDILNHNVETVPRLYTVVRPQAKYDRSLNVLAYFKERGLVTKSGVMVGIGEKPEEILEVMKDLRRSNVDILTVGQYLQPTKQHLPIDRYVTPDEFEMYKRTGLEMGFKFVESGPLVRSSYHADEQIVF
ncbi:MAG: lipoyl synthase [Bacteroidetes bacterium]|nr:lipoyl synthase [Bacteroidota bacterium]MCL5737644.1 lipoyl synthase [Bacteroidota bacterium]